MENTEYKELINLFLIYRDIPPYLKINSSFNLHLLELIDECVFEIKICEKQISEYQELVFNQFNFTMTKENVIRILKLHPRTLILINNTSLKDTATRDMVVDDLFKLFTGVTTPRYGHQLTSEEHAILDQIIQKQIRNFNLDY